MTAALLKKIVNWVYPPLCPVSQQVVEAPGQLAPAGWRDLNFVAAPYCRTCGMPFDLAYDPGADCASCLDMPPVFDALRAGLVYDGVSRPLILAFKHGDRLYLKDTLLTCLERAMAEMPQVVWDYIAPVPLHWTRLVRRRYNQSAILAHELSSRHGIPYRPGLLRRVRATPPQGHKNRAQRKRNVDGVFDTPPDINAPLQGRSVLLVDDVATSGATLNACALALKQAGAMQVGAVVVARVPFSR